MYDQSIERIFISTKQKSQTFYDLKEYLKYKEGALLVVESAVHLARSLKVWNISSFSFICTTIKTYNGVFF